MNDNMKVVAIRTKVGRMFKLDVNMPKFETAMYGETQSHITDLNIWHKRIGHLNFQRLKNLPSSGLVTGLPKFNTSDPSIVCSACQFGKHTRQPFSHQGTRSSQSLELIHSDVWTSPHPSLSGCKYFVTFIDDYSRKTWVYFLKLKSETFGAFKTFKAMVEKQTGHSILTLRTDGGGEYMSGEFETFLAQEGIISQVTCAYSPQ